MKTLFIFFTIVLLITTLQAKVVYLNNNLEAPNISENQYTTWADAYAAASAGDTIYIVGSNFSYGDFTINRSLTIIGPGYYLTQNSETQVNKEIAEIHYLILGEGADGTHLIGLAVTGNYGILVTDQIDNLLLENCYIQVISLGFNANYIYENLEIKKCFIFGQIQFNYNYNAHIANLVLTNNIIGGNVNIEEGSNGIISHNLFLSNFLSLDAASSFEFSNNIYLNKNETYFTIQSLPDASVHHNISLTGAFGDANNNFTAPESTLFNTDQNATSDGMYMLSENSPAKGAGSNGSDIGPFGGPDPYRLSGLPNLPNIYELSTVGLVSGDKLPVTIKIKQ